MERLCQVQPYPVNTRWIDERVVAFRWYVLAGLYCRNKLYDKSTANRSNGIRGLQLTDCSKQPRLVDCRIGVVNKLDRPRRRLAVAKCFKSGVWDKVPEARTLILKIPKFPYSTVWDRWKKASVPKTSSIRPVVSIQYRLVRNRHNITWHSNKKCDKLQVVVS